SFTGTARFDMDGDGFRERVGWADAQDALLVLDLNADGSRGAGDGKIDQAKEVVLSLWGDAGMTDMEALAKARDASGTLIFDSNGDGTLTAADAAWHEFRVWQDADQDGVTDAVELKTLDEMGFTQIGLTYDDGSSYGETSDDVIIQGAALHGAASYIRNGQTVVGGVGDATLIYEVEGLREVTDALGLRYEFESGEVLRVGQVQGRASPDFDLAAAGLAAAIGDARANRLDASGLTRGTILTGDAGADTLTGGAGHDVLIGGTGADVMAGGAGNDVIVVDAEDGLFSGAVSGGTGIDTLVLDMSQGVTIAALSALGIEAASAGSGADSLTGDKDDVNYVLAGNAGADTLTGAGGKDILLGGSGADVLTGRAGDDALFGGSEDDRLFGGLGDDQLTGEAGNDLLDGAEGDDVLDGGSGSDSLQGGAGADVLHATSGTQLLEGGAGDDAYIVGFQGLAAVIRDAEGVNTLTFAADVDPASLALTREGDDLVIRLRGSATNVLRIEGQFGAKPPIAAIGFSGFGIAVPLSAGLANASVLPVLTLASGSNPVQGGTANDWITGSRDASGGDGADLLAGTEGNDLLSGDAGADLVFGGDGADRLSGGDGADGLFGGAGADTLLGGGESDVLDGGAGADRLEGGEGADLLSAGEGDDALFGGAGDDVLISGGGADALSGEAGADVFVIARVAGAQTTLHDFRLGEDRINLSAAVPSAWLPDGALTQVGADAVLALADGQTLVVQNTTVAGLLTSGSLILPRRGTGAELTPRATAPVAGGAVLPAALTGAGVDLAAERGAAASAAAEAPGFDPWTTDTPVATAAVLRAAAITAGLSEAVRDATQTAAGVPATQTTGAGSITVATGEAAVGAGAISYATATVVGAHGIDYATDRFGAGAGAIGYAWDFAWAGAGHVSFGPAKVIGGRDGNETLTGRDAGEIYWANGGNDRILSFGGNDSIDAGWGNDTAWGGYGSDLILGRDGDDTLYGEWDNDLVHGENGNDLVFGQDGNDDLTGGAGWDRLWGGSGSDRMWGGTEGDEMYGESGNDV
ncbi:MAG: hypothetical protein IOC72_10060, partial [Rhodobacter sp.]|nr:hypothetical protein [Rhodobacter sp.]